MVVFEVGQIFNNLELIEQLPSNIQGTRWKCRCVMCGRETEKPGKTIKSKGCRSCKNQEKGMRVRKDKVGLKFGNGCEVIKNLGVDKYNHSKFLAKCSCGNLFEVLTYNLKTREGCKECRIKNMSGPAHHNYRHDLSNEDRENLALKLRWVDLNYRVFIKSVFIRDKYRCQLCGSNKSGNLSVHHLDGYTEYIEKRCDINNGITLCKDCHKDFHMKYGYGKNTSSQFNEYFKKVVFGEIDYADNK